MDGQNRLALAVSELSAVPDTDNTEQHRPGLDNEGRLSSVPQRLTASIVHRDH